MEIQFCPPVERPKSSRQVPRSRRFTLIIPRIDKRRQKQLHSLKGLFFDDLRPRQFLLALWLYRVLGFEGLDFINKHPFQAFELCQVKRGMVIGFLNLGNRVADRLFGVCAGCEIERGRCGAKKRF
ncbi:MAG: hypothetical protein QM527_13875 [Alphaproteobacteria bacterium]|nr:hypothetical protein [Alphaproteobacteria bacterium]